MKKTDIRSDGIFLTERFFVCYGLVQLLGIAALEFNLLTWIYVGATILLGALLIYDKQYVPPGYLVSGTLDMPEFIRLQQTIKVPFHLQARTHKSFNCRIYAEFPPTENISTASNKIKLSNLNGFFDITGRVLGRIKLADIYVLVLSPLGMWVRGKNIPLKTFDSRVEPKHRNVGEQEFMRIARSNQLVLGSRLWGRSQSADQYYSTRKFQYSDSLRHIDQKKTAKYSEIMTKTFEEMRSHRLIIALDLGRNMSGEVGGSSKHNFYISAALELAKHAIRFRDTVDFFAFSQKVHMTISGAKVFGPFQVLVEESEALRPQMSESNYEILNAMTTRLTGQRSIVVLLTDVSRPGVQSMLLKTLPSICRKHLTVALGLIDQKFDLDTQVLSFNKSIMDGDDIGHFTYCYWLNHQNRLFQRQISKFGGGSLALSEENWLGVTEKLYRFLRYSSHA